MIETELKKINAYLEGFVVEKRLERFSQVLDQRLSHLHIVLEDLYQGHNASAVLRSCDGFGVQHVHFIENKNKLRINDDIAMGSSKWLSIHRYNGEGNNTLTALQELKAKGFKIVATSPHQNDTTLDKLAVDQKIALVFGTEMLGISQDVIAEADAFVKLPMLGFTESFNISVCAALCLYELTRRIRLEVAQPYLTEQERETVYHQWLCASIDQSEALVRRFLEQKK